MGGQIDIVIVNWNSRDMLRRCVASIEAAGVEDIASVIVVDNASHDGSADQLGAADKLVLVRNEANRGFARACNQGAKAGKSPLILFLNPDTELTAASIVHASAHYASSAPDHLASSVGVQLRSSDGSIARTCSRFPTPRNILAHSFGLDRVLPRFFPSAKMLEWDHKQTRWVDQVMGAFFLVRRIDFEDVGGFDERFFVYFEEVDYCKRWALKGRRALYIADAHVLHHGHGTTRHARAAALFCSLRSRVLYAHKHFGSLAAVSILAATFSAEPTLRLLQSVARRDRAGIRETVGGYILMLCWLAGR